MHEGWIDTARQAATAEPVTYDQVEPLFTALDEPQAALRLQALRALVRLPLDERGWLRLADRIGPELWNLIDSDLPLGDLEDREAVWIPAGELIAAAAFVPVAEVRELLVELAHGKRDDLAWMAAKALARTRSPQAVDPLLVRLDDADASAQERLQAAQYLAVLDVSQQAARLQALCSTMTDPVMRFWLGLSLAYLEQNDCLLAALDDLQQAGPAVSPLEPYPIEIAPLLQARGALPAAVEDLLQRTVTGFALSPLISYLLELGAPFGSGVSKGLESQPPVKGAQPELQQQAQELAQAYRQEPPFDDQGWLRQRRNWLLTYLPADEQRTLVSNLFAQLPQLPPEAQDMAGQQIMQLPVWDQVQPDVAHLAGVYTRLDQRAAGVRTQVAWAAGRAGVEHSVRDLLPQLQAADDPQQRVQLAHLLEQVACWANVAEPPDAYGTGAGSQWADVLPPAKAGLRVQREMAAVERRPQPEPRWLQAQVEELQDGAAVSRRKALRRDAPHRLLARIGRRDDDFIQPPVTANFPIDELPTEPDVYELQVVLSEPNHIPEPLQDTIFLPRAGGDSSTCTFEFRTRADVSGFEGRLAVLYNGRILQSMLLTAQVLDDPDGAAPGVQIALQPETPVRANLSGMEGCQGFDAALVADVSAQGHATLQEIAGAHIALRSLENLETPLKRIRAKLNGVTNSPEQFDELRSDETLDLLRFLARHGHMLYSELVEKQIADHPLRTARRIQLVSARESFLPLEYLYERPSPSPNAKLCPNAEQALESGTCEHCQALAGREARRFICPLGFWGLTRVIERHWVRPVAEAGLEIGEFALQSDPVCGRDALDNVLAAAVCAISDRVRQEDVQTLQQAVSQATGQQAEFVADWDDWCTAVEQRGPSLLLLLPHTLQDDDFIPTLEIGAGQQLPEDQLDESFVRLDPQEHPLVLLLGCETAVPDVPFYSFALQFRKYGAAIVLSTLTPVLGRHAGPLAALLLSELSNVAAHGGTFGEAMLRLRRRALAGGFPAALSLVPYGDAEWRLIPTQAPAPQAASPSPSEV